MSVKGLTYKSPLLLSCEKLAFVIESFLFANTKR